MNIEHLFSNQSLDNILKVNNALYDLRASAKTREDKINALETQIAALNQMNEVGGKYSKKSPNIKLGLPKDFVSNFLNDADINELWAATHINKGVEDKATILGNMRDVFRVFTYLDFIHPAKTEGIIQPPSKDKKQPASKDNEEKKDNDDGDIAVVNNAPDRDDIKDEDDEKEIELDKIENKKEPTEKKPEEIYDMNMPGVPVFDRGFDKPVFNINSGEDQINQLAFQSRSVAEVMVNGHGPRQPRARARARTPEPPQIRDATPTPQRQQQVTRNKRTGKAEARSLSPPRIDTDIETDTEIDSSSDEEVMNVRDTPKPKAKPKPKPKPKSKPQRRPPSRRIAGKPAEKLPTNTGNKSLDQINAAANMQIQREPEKSKEARDKHKDKWANLRQSSAKKNNKKMYPDISKTKKKRKKR